MCQRDMLFAERLMTINMDEESRRAQSHRLVRQARAGQQTWLSRQARPMLVQVGRGLVALGRWFQQVGPSQSHPVEGQPVGG
jgi:hypothetical protein